MTGVMELVDLSLLEADVGKIPCRSSLRHHQKPHDAVWWAISPCEDVTPVCERRRQKCFQDGGWNCVILDGSVCTAFHAYEVLTFSPVRD